MCERLLRQSVCLHSQSPPQKLCVDDESLDSLVLVRTGAAINEGASQPRRCLKNKTTTTTTTKHTHTKRVKTLLILALYIQARPPSFKTFRMVIIALERVFLSTLTHFESCDPCRTKIKVELNNVYGFLGCSFYKQNNYRNLYPTQLHLQKGPRPTHRFKRYKGQLKFSRENPSRMRR